MKILITGGSGFIGTNLIAKLHSMSEHILLNLDISKPKDRAHLKYWKECDILIAAELNKQVEIFDPDAVIHLAARTDTDDGNLMEDYLVNTEGSQNILRAIKNNPNIGRVIMTSTQFVNQYNGVPKDDEDFAPHTVYGKSKVIMEQMTRQANLACTWTLIRPTNIWGPWHLRYPQEFWKVLSRGLYFHPGKEPVVRSYGYVGNVVHQIISILLLSPEKVDKKVFYVGDSPIDIYDWVNGFSLKQTGKKVRIIPRFAIRFLALLGDFLSLFKIKFPLTSSRYKSMTTSNAVQMQRSFDVLGIPPYNLDQGIDETITWMKAHHPNLVNEKR
jgi:GlcNAc-P-P-Und epimerase